MSTIHRVNNFSNYHRKLAGKLFKFLRNGRKKLTSISSVCAARVSKSLATGAILSKVSSASPKLELAVIEHGTEENKHVGQNGRTLLLVSSITHYCITATEGNE